MIKPIAFYLPQYHPVPENDTWWGPGFTEWQNVAKARPNFEGHYQPHIPADLGFYDLRLVEVQKKQAEMAKAYGIFGFCYYYYWFNGRRILEKPLNQMLAHPEVDMPFCVCWANENWTRTWDGHERDILLGQNHSPEDDEAFLRSLFPLFADPRYIRVDGKPMLLVYRTERFPDIAATARRWRALAAKEGVGELYLCAVQFYGTKEPAEMGFDAHVEFPPHHFIKPETLPSHEPETTNPLFRGTLVDYQKVVVESLQRPTPAYTVYRGVMPSWDNTARRQHTPHVFINSSPSDYQYWLRRIAAQTEKLHPVDRQFVFINAWNEWGEGCHLEPDVRHGHAFLRATRAAINGQSTVEDVLAEMKASGHFEMNAPLHDLADAFESRERSLYALQAELRRKDAVVRDLPGIVKDPSIRNFLKLKLGQHPRLKRQLKKAIALARSAISGG